jgi:formate/nitrite transporter FocA (FNT family)
MAGMNYWVPLVFAAILISLGFAYVYLVRGNPNKDSVNRNMARALGFRVAFSIILFLWILAGWKLGYIHPTGIPIKT